MSEYKVKFEVFEGPLDLLLYLIKKQEVDIYEVNLTQLASQFIEYIEVMRHAGSGDCRRVPRDGFHAHVHQEPRAFAGGSSRSRWKKRKTAKIPAGN